MKNKLIPLCIASAIIGLSFLYFTKNKDAPPTELPEPVQIGRANPHRPFPSKSVDDLSTAPLHSNKEKLVITPANAKKLLEQCKRESLKLTDQAIAASDIIAKLCENGHIQLAWSLIDQSQGMIRNSQLTSFFRSTKFTSSEDIQTYLSNLHDTKDRNYSIYGLVQGSTKTALAMQASIIPGTSNDEKFGFVFGISDLLKDPNISSDLARSAIDRSIELTASSSLSPNDLDRIFSSSGTTDAFANWQSVSNYNKSFEPKTLEKVQSGMVRSMIVSNPSQTMNIICEDSTTKYSYPVLSSAIHEYCKQSQDGVNSWLLQNLDKIDPATSQRIISVVAQEANQNLEYETSRSWANKILNAEVRQQLLDQVDKREAEKSNPQLK